jgi:iron(III) transport system permease protein
LESRSADHDAHADPRTPAHEDIVLLPMAVPSIAFALAVAAFWLWAPKAGAYTDHLDHHHRPIGRYSSYATRAISSSLVQIHPELEESARVFGVTAGETRCAGSTLPLVFPSIVASWVMVYSIFISELSMVLPLYTAETRTLSILSFDVWSNGLSRRSRPSRWRSSSSAWASCLPSAPSRADARWRRL